jgi:hypothetical protein
MLGVFWVGPFELLLVLVFFVGLAVPAYVVGRRRGVSNPGVAFIPFIGPTLVILWSIGRSGWLCILGLVPLVALVFDIWLAFVVPAGHGRTRWWALAFLIPLAQLAAFYVYAFTLQETRKAEAPAH